MVTTNKLLYVICTYHNSNLPPSKGNNYELSEKCKIVRHRKIIDWRLQSTKDEMVTIRKGGPACSKPQSKPSKLTNAINLVLIDSMHSSQNLNSWLVSKTRISITDFDDFFTWATFTGLSVIELDKGFWTESWSPVRTVNQWVWVFRTLSFQIRRSQIRIMLKLLSRLLAVERLLIWKKMLAKR